jgi:predicted ATP-grasp superfamily ATP-dependent carboligase
VNVFVYEYTCASAVGPDAGSASLRAEGAAMLTAALADFGRVPGVRVSPLPPSPLGGGDQREEPAFRGAARSADYALVIAPEFDGLLEERVRWAEEEGAALLGPTSAAIRLTADKLELGRFLAARGVPTPTPTPVAEGRPPAGQFVCKPRDGAGSLGVRVNEWPAADEADRFIVQPLVPGRAASVAFLIGPGRCPALPPCWQNLSDDGGLTYLGGSLPLPADLAARAERVARRAVEAVPGLHGYVGVDVVLGDAGRGEGDWVIEINPRLTTSYVGLRALAGFNLAEALLAVVRGEEPSAMTWRAEAVEFRCDGTAEFKP